MDFYPADYTPPPWIEVHASVLRFDPEALRGRVTDTLARGGDEAAYASTRGRRVWPTPTPTPATDDVHSLVSRLLRPQRPQRAAAKAALEGVRTEDGVAALVARGLLPAAWSTDPPRFSALDPKTRILPPSPTPTRPLLVALGADPEGIAAALSRWTAYREALQLWTRTQRPGGVIWCDATLPTGWAARRCDRDNQPLEAALSWVEALCGVEVDTVGPPVALDGPTRAAMFEASVGDAEALRDLCLETRAKAIRALFPAQERLDLDFDTVARVWAADRVWEVLRALDLRYHHPPVAAALRRRGDAPRRWAARDGEALGSLTMPFAPLIALWGLGYPIRATRGSDDVLGVAPLDSPKAP